MTQDELRRWADSQIAVLLSCGVDAMDAQATVKRVLAKLPEGADPRTWLPPVDSGEVVITDADIADARAAWYASDAVPAKYKRLLDSTTDEG